MAEEIIRDADSNRLSIVNLIDDTTPAAYPFLMPKVTVLIVADRGGDSIQSTTLIMIMRSSTKGEILRMPLPFEFQDYTTARYILRIASVVAENPARVTIEVATQEGTTLATTYFNLLASPATAAPPPAPSPAQTGSAPPLAAPVAG